MQLTCLDDRYPMMMLVCGGGHTLKDIYNYGIHDSDTKPHAIQVHFMWVMPAISDYDCFCE